MLVWTHSKPASFVPLPALVHAWREANPSIVDFWSAIDAAAKQALTIAGGRAMTHAITFTREAGILFCTLPSQRRLAHPGAAITTGRFGRGGYA